MTVTSAPRIAAVRSWTYRSDNPICTRTRDTLGQVTVRPCGDRKPHADPACKIARLPQPNRDYWLPKLDPNAARDAQRTAKLN